MPHRTVKSAASPVAASASSPGQTGHAGRITLAGKIPLRLCPDGRILGREDKEEMREMLQSFE